MVTGRGDLRPWDPIFWRKTKRGALNAVIGNTPPGDPPIDIANIADIEWWGDPSDTASITATAGAISSIANQIGAGSPASFTLTSTPAPKTGTRTLGGQNAIEYDSTGDGRLATTGTNLRIRTDSFTCAATFEMDGTSNDGVFNRVNPGINGGSWGFYRETAVLYAVFSRPSTSHNCSISMAAAGVHAVLQRVTRNGASSKNELWVDGTLVDTETFTDAAEDLNYGGNDVAMGMVTSISSYRLDGTIGDTIWIRRAISDDEVTALNLALMTRCGI